MRPIDADALIAEFEEYIRINRFYGNDISVMVAEVLTETIIDAPTIEQPTWISCAEEKLKQRRTYFISYIFNDNEEMSFYGTAMFHPEEDADNGLVKGPHFSNEGVEGMRVTHWMRIPPKGG